ncbi:MAG: class I SAM-dependent methyltransferase, partial [Sulfobacillus sp.]
YQSPDLTAERRLASVRNLGRSIALSSLGYQENRIPLRAAALLHRLIPAPIRGRGTYGYGGFPPFVPDGRVLDIGCGNGAFLAVLRKHGWVPFGVDASPAAARAAAVVNIPVHVGELETVPFEESSFDFVHLQHSIEHAWDPLSTLNSAFSLLRPGGIAYIETPNVECFTFRHCGSNWFPLESPRHLWLFSPTTLRRALGKSGFVVDRMWTVGCPVFRWESAFRYEELVGHMQEDRPKLLRHDLPRAAFLGSIAFVLQKISQYNGETVACWARRPD